MDGTILKFTKPVYVYQVFSLRISSIDYGIIEQDSVIIATVICREGYQHFSTNVQTIILYKTGKKKKKNYNNNKKNFFFKVE